MLIQAQVNEEQRFHQLNEFHNLEADQEALSHKYDRKELCLQNLERKTNYYEMYIVKKASSYGQNDKEANLLLKKFQHEKFSGGIGSNDLFNMQEQDDAKLSNIVQENIELKKQNSDLKLIVDKLVRVKDIHQQLMDKCK